MTEPADTNDFDVPQRHVCAVCGRVLTHCSGRGFAHAFSDQPADHPAVPVPDTDVPVIARCDFCHVDNPEWVLPAADFAVIGEHVSRGDWAACTDCARLIETNQWNALVRRARTGWDERHGEPMPNELASVLPTLYRLLRRNITAALRPVNPAK